MRIYNSLGDLPAVNDQLYGIGTSFTHFMISIEEVAKYGKLKLGGTP